MQNERLQRQIHVGLCGAGIGGCAAGIALARAGARVTILEAATELTEIGAGIQMTPNVARLLQKWGVADVIGRNLCKHNVFTVRRRDGTPVGRVDAARIERQLGHPWWVVHRHHLLTALVEVARRNGCAFHTSSRVLDVQHDTPDKRVRVRTEGGQSYDFDLIVGSDGLNSVIRKSILPDAKPEAPTNNASYRAVIDMKEVRDDPETEPLVRTPNMDAWIGPNGYIITYPISGYDTFNLVFSHHRPYRLTVTEQVDFDDVLKEYEDYDPVIQKVIRKLDRSQIQRWPLFQTGPLPTWSSPDKNAVLLGDAAHSMVNHMAQGAATSMEDGTFLACCVREAMNGRISLAEAVDIYEIGRMPKARMKQQVSFLNAVIWTLPDGPMADGRDKAMEPELRNEPMLRSPNLYSDPLTVMEVYGYDVEEHAAQEINDWIRGGRKPKHGQKDSGHEIDEQTAIERWRVDRTVNWFMPKGTDWRPVKEGAMEVRTGTLPSKL